MDYYQHSRRTTHSLLDRPIGKGITMAKKQDKSKESTTKTTSDSSHDFINQQLRGKLKRCMGQLCFEDGGITVKVNREKDLECAELVNKAILQGKRVVFELTPEDIELVES